MQCRAAVITATGRRAVCLPLRCPAAGSPDRSSLRRRWRLSVRTGYGRMRGATDSQLRLE